MTWQLAEDEGKSLFRKGDEREQATVKSEFDWTLGTVLIYPRSSFGYFSSVYVPLKSIFILK